MHQSNLPATVLLQRTKNDYYQELKHTLQSWDINVLDISVLAEVSEKTILETIPVAMAIVDEINFSGIDFLRSVMHANNWIQRMMLAPQMDLEFIERAVNKAHINYLLQLPVNKAKLESFLNKASRRFDFITRPFAKFDALTNVTEELLADNEKFRMEATIDPLTKLMNRRSFNKVLERVWGRYKEKGIPFSLAILDIDHFKRVNDTWGHPVGDLVLQKIAHIMHTNQRIGIDYAFRYGGEEFAIISSNTNGREMNLYLERLLHLVSEARVLYKTDEIGVTFSAGVSEVSDGHTPEDLINLADGALYKAKESGRNQVLLAR